MTRLSVAAASLLLACGAANAELLSGFEQGFDGWQTLGDVSIQTASIGLAPMQGTRLAFISTMCDRTVPPAQVFGTSACNTTVNEHPYAGVSSPYAGFARAFLGLPFDTAGFAAMVPVLTFAVGESGALSFHFQADRPGDLAFDWNRIGIDGDAAFFTLWADDGSSRTTDIVFSYTTFSGSFVPSGVDLCSRYHDAQPWPACAIFNAETGWSTRTVPVPGAGGYTIGFALSEGGEGTTPTVLALDNLRFVATPVSEPSRLAVTAIGLLAVAWVVRRRRQD